MHVLIIASQKGGSSKTTLARNLAVAAATKKSKVMLLDMDPQQSLRDWWKVRKADRPEMTADNIPPANLGLALQQLAKAGYALTVIDTPPSVHPELRDVLRHADLVVVPIRPSPDDLRAVGGTLGRIAEAKVPFVFVMTQVKPRTRLAKEAERVLSSHGEVAPVVIQDRVEYAMSAATGEGVCEKEGKAGKEIQLLYQYLLNRMRKRK